MRGVDGEQDMEEEAIAALRSPPKGMGASWDYEAEAFTGTPKGSFNPYDIVLTGSTTLDLGTWTVPTDLDHIKLDRIIVGLTATTPPTQGFLQVSIGSYYRQIIPIVPILRDKNQAVYFGGMTVKGGQKINLQAQSDAASVISVAIRYLRVGKNVPRLAPVRPDLWQERYEGTDSWPEGVALTAGADTNIGTWNVPSDYDVVGIHSLQIGTNDTGTASKHSAGTAFGRGAFDSGYLKYQFGAMGQRQIPLTCIFADQSSSLHFGGRFMPRGTPINVRALTNDTGLPRISVTCRHRAYFAAVNETPGEGPNPEKAQAEV